MSAAGNGPNPKPKTNPKPNPSPELARNLASPNPDPDPNTNTNSRTLGQVRGPRWRGQAAGRWPLRVASRWGRSDRHRRESAAPLSLWRAPAPTTVNTLRAMYTTGECGRGRGCMRRAMHARVTGRIVCTTTGECLTLSPPGCLIWCVVGSSHEGLRGCVVQGTAGVYSRGARRTYSFRATRKLR